VYTHARTCVRTRAFLHVLMRDLRQSVLPHEFLLNLKLLRINQEMINTYLNFIMRVNWRINQEMIITQLNSITIIKWMLLARSMTPVRGHTYKRLGGSPE
jgi:hypothetical protein